jgi:hypothetical protein
LAVLVVNEEANDEHEHDDDDEDRLLFLNVHRDLHAAAFARYVDSTASSSPSRSTETGVFFGVLTTEPLSFVVLWSLRENVKLTVGQ